MYRLCIVFLLCGFSAQEFGAPKQSVEILHSEGYLSDAPERHIRVRRTQSHAYRPCQYTQTILRGKNVCADILIFNDDFDELRNDTWQSDIKFADNPDFEFVMYGNDYRNLYISNGQLHIKPTLAEDKYDAGFVTRSDGLDLGSNCTGIPDSLECKQKPTAYFILPPILSARITSKRSFSFLYGKVEIRAKLPKGDWIYPELFLTPKNFEYGDQNYDSGEIRIAFLAGNKNYSKQLKGGIVLGTDETTREFGSRSSVGETPYNDDFHVYTAIWQPNDISVLVDGEVYGTIIPTLLGFANGIYLSKPEVHSKWDAGDNMAPFDKEMFITIGVGVGGHSFPDSLTDKPYNNIDGKAQLRFYRAKDAWFPTWTEESELIVDYIKVYSLDDSERNRCSKCRVF